jgi:hypothetical protein
VDRPFFADGKLKKVSTTGAALQVDRRGAGQRARARGGTTATSYFAPTNIAGHLARSGSRRPAAQDHTARSRPR